MIGGLATNLAANMRNALSIIKRDWGSLDVPLLGVGADTLELLVGEIDRLRADVVEGANAARKMDDMLQKLSNSGMAELWPDSLHDEIDVARGIDPTAT